jgi:hypothetical protein
MTDRETVIYTDRTFMVGEFAVRILLKGDARYGESGATWSASTHIPFRVGEDAPTHFTIGTASDALGAVLALSRSVQDKAEVVLYLTPVGADGSITPVYATLGELSSNLTRLAWGTVAGWTGQSHPGHPTFEEVTQVDAA